MTQNDLDNLRTDVEYQTTFGTKTLVISTVEMLRLLDLVACLQEELSDLRELGND